MQTTVQAELQLALQNHGVAIAIDREAIIVPAGPVRLETQVVDESESQGHSVVSVHVAASSDKLGQGPLVDSHAGVGLTREAAIQSAFVKFLLGSFHVILESLANHSCAEEQGTWHNWSASNCDWRVCVGPVVCQGEDPSGGFSRALESFVTSLRPFFIQLAPTSAHWFRVFLCSFENEVKAVEVLLDNEDWPAANELATLQAWPTSSTYTAARVFAIGLPHPQNDG